jgi:hypothetical protein
MLERLPEQVDEARFVRLIDCFIEGTWLPRHDPRRS